MSWRQLHSVFLGLTTWSTPGGDGIVVRRHQDCGGIVEHNKRLQSNDRSSTRIGAGGIVASIPLIILERWGHEIGRPIMSLPREERHAFVMRKLRDPEWQYLRTVGHRI